MAKNNQEFTTVVTLNAKQAKDELKLLQDNIDKLKAKKDALIKDPNSTSGAISKANKDLREAQAKLNAYKSSVSDVIDTLNDLGNASLGEIEKAVRQLKKRMKDVTDPDEYKALDDVLQKANARILELKDAAGDSAKQMKENVEAGQNLSNVLTNLNTSSLDELKRAAATAKENMEKLQPDSAAYKSAAADLSKIKNRINEVETAQKSANETIDKYDKEIADATRAAADLTRENKLIEQTLKNIDGSNIRDLEYSLKLVNEQLRGTNRGDARFDELTEKARQLKEEIKKVNDELNVPEKKGNIIQRSADFLNRNWGAITQAWAGITGLTSTVRQCTNAYAEMEDVMADTMKYTGQSKEEVVEMNEDFKKMDTRTSREQLNALAGAAGRLGITSKEAIEEFVDAADKISVSLGDDLGKGAVDQIGKLAMAFGEDEKKGLRGAMLATGSAVNELAQSCSANAGYLVDFTARVAGVGKQFGLSQTQIMGFGAVMDENMQKDEMASTAFSQLLTKMTTDTKTFAKMAGIPFEDFSKMLKENANEAVIKFLESLNNKGNFTTLAKMFQDMNLDGTRATAVLTTMADKIEDIKKRQQTAFDAYEAGQSVIDEFDTKNETVQAGLDKAKKNFQELTITLGQKLLPIARYGVSAASASVRALNAIINFTLRYWRTLIPLTVAIGAYTLALKWNSIEWGKLKVVKAANLVLDKAYAAIQALNTAATVTVTTAYKYMTGQITAASAAQTILNKVILANPYVAAAAAAAGLTAALIAVISKTDDATEAQRDLAEANRQAAVDCRGEIEELSQLVEIAKDKTTTDTARKEAIKQLQDKYPDYLSNLNQENIYTTEAAEAVSNLTNQILAQAQARVYLAKVEEMEREKADVDEEYLESWWGTMRHGLASQFESFANNIADFAERLWNAGGEFFKNGDGGFTLKGLKNGWNDDTYITRNGYATTPGQVYYQNWRGDWNYYDKKQKEFLAKYQKTEKRIAESTAKLRENNKALGGGKEEDKPDDGNYITNDERKAQEKADKAAARAAANAQKRREAEARKAAAQAKKDQKAAIDAQKALTDVELVENYRRYSQGEIDLRQYRQKEYEIRQEGLDEQIKIYGEDSDQAKELLKKKADLEEDHNKEVTKMDEDEIKRRHASIALDLQAALNKQGSIMYQNQEAINEALYENDLDALQERQALYQKGSEEWLNLQAEIEQMEGEHKLQNAQHYNELLASVQEEYGNKTNEAQKTLAMNGLDWLEHYELQKLDEMYDEEGKKTEEYNRKKNEITRKYAELRTNMLLHYEHEQSENNLYNSSGEKFQRNTNTIKETASNNANAKYQNEHPTGTSLTDYISSDISIYASTIANLKSQEADFAAYHKQLVEEGLETKEDADAAIEENHKETMAAMAQATGELAGQIASKMQAAYDAISPIMDAMSSYYSAQCDLEVAKTEKKYEKQIEKAGNNSAKRKKLEEKQEKEIAKIKTKYAKKQAKMQIAQAIVTTAMSALNAYSSVMAGAPWPANMVLAPIAAGLALAAGAIQIATIKKQQQAQEAGYYEGGFTGGSSYRREAGVVHEGEFVANHNAVNNPQLLPALQLIDIAQRNNTVGSLTAADVSRSMGVGGTAIIQQTPVVVNNDNSELQDTLLQARDTIERLGALLESGDINCRMPDWDEFDRSHKHFQNLQSNK